jgi:hypothetical protein
LLFFFVLLLLQAASVSLMSAKDARLGLMGQLLAHMAVVKALGWEQVLGDKVRVQHQALLLLPLDMCISMICGFVYPMCENARLAAGAGRQGARATANMPQQTCNSKLCCCCRLGLALV